MIRTLLLVALALLAIASSACAERWFVGSSDHAGVLEWDRDAKRATGNLVHFDRHALGPLRTRELPMELELQPLANGDFGVYARGRVGLRGRVTQRRLEARRRVGTLTPRGSRNAVGRLYGHPVSLRRAPDLPPELEVILVRGLACLLYERIGPALDENQRTFEALGVPVIRAEVSSIASVADNAAILRELIRERVAAGRRPLIVAHSKGVADSIAALAELEPLWPQLYGVVAMQSAYRGSPIAELMLTTPWFRTTVGTLFDDVLPVATWEHGGREAVLDLTREACRARAEREQPARIFQEVPLVTVRSWLDPEKRSFELDKIHDPLAQVFLPFMAGHGPSDGMVLYADQELPGARVDLTYRHLSHAESILRGRQTEFTPCYLTHRMLDGAYAAISAPAPGLATPDGRGRPYMQVDGYLGQRTHLQPAKPTPRAPQRRRQ